MAMIREVPHYVPLISELADALRLRIKHSDFHVTENERELLSRCGVILTGRWSMEDE